MGDQANIHTFAVLADLSGGIKMLRDSTGGIQQITNQTVAHYREIVQKYVQYWRKNVQVREQMLEKAQVGLRQSQKDKNPDTARFYQTAIHQAREAQEDAEQTLKKFQNLAQELERAAQAAQMQIVHMNLMMEKDMRQAEVLLARLESILTTYAGDQLSGKANSSAEIMLKFWASLPTKNEPPPESEPNSSPSEHLKVIAAMGETLQEETVQPPLVKKPETLEELISAIERNELKPSHQNQNPARKPADDLPPEYHSSRSPEAQPMPEIIRNPERMG